MRPLYLTLLAALFALTNLCAEELKVAEEHRSAGIVALQESQKTPRQVVAAARHFAKAAAIFEKLGDADGAVEMNSFLYWCKKKMTLDDIEAFHKGGEAVVTERLKAVEAQKIEKTDAQIWYDRADTFAKAKPGEHLLIAIRFFEVADRFIGTELSVKAQRRSLDEMQLASAAAPAKADPPPSVPARPVVEVAVKVAIPDAAKLKDAEKTIKDIFKDEFAKRSADDKKALGQKLLQQASETKDDPVSRYVLLKESAAAASAGADAETALKALDALGQHYELDALALKADALGKILPTTADAAKALARVYLKVIDDAVAADNYDAAVKLATAADTVARKAQDMPLVTQLQARGKEVRALQTDFAKVKAAQATLKEKPDDPEANLAVGKFLCFVKGDWEKGLPLLAKGSDAKLKELAEKEGKSPSIPDEQMFLADSWWSLSEKASSREKHALVTRAIHWYEQTYPKLTGLMKIKVGERLAAIGGNHMKSFYAVNYSRQTKTYGPDVLDELSADEGPASVRISGTNQNDAATHKNVFYSHNGKLFLPKQVMRREEYVNVTYKILSNTKFVNDGPMFSVVGFKDSNTSSAQEVWLSNLPIGKTATICFAINGNSLDVLVNGEKQGVIDIGQIGRIGIAGTTRYRGNRIDGVITPSINRGK